MNKPTAQAGQLIHDDRHEPLAAPMTDGRCLMPILNASGESLSQPKVGYPIRSGLAQRFEMRHPVGNLDHTSYAIEDRRDGDIGLRYSSSR